MAVTAWRYGAFSPRVGRHALDSLGQRFTEVRRHGLCGRANCIHGFAQLCFADIELPAPIDAFPPILDVDPRSVARRLILEIFRHGFFTQANPPSILDPGEGCSWTQMLHTRYTTSKCEHIGGTPSTLPH